MICRRARGWVALLRREGWGLKSLQSQAWRGQQQGRGGISRSVHMLICISLLKREAHCLNVCARCFLSHVAPFSLHFEYVFPFICVLGTGLWLCTDCRFGACTVPAVCWRRGPWWCPGCGCRCSEGLAERRQGSILGTGGGGNSAVSTCLLFRVENEILQK